MGIPVGYSVNLGLGDTPGVKDPELFAEATKIYSALKNLALNLDNALGLSLYDDVDRENISPIQTIKSDLQNKLYVTYNVPITAGKTVGFINSGGELQAVLGTSGTVRGVAVETKNAGEKGLVILFGLWVTSGIVIGDVYYASSSGAITRTAPAVGSRQPIGFGISDTAIFFNPSLVLV
jgi:hypothetical protein